MALKPPLANTHPLSKDVRMNIAFNAPIPGSSLTKEHGSMPYEHPPQFTKLTDAVHHMMDQMTEPYYMKQLFQFMDAGVAIEAIARTLIFTGFTLGKWTVDLGMLMYKPIMLALLAIAHRAGFKDTPVLLPSAVVSNGMNNLKSQMQANKMKDLRKKAMDFSHLNAPPAVVPEPNLSSNKGFMQKPTGAI